MRRLTVVVLVLVYVPLATGCSMFANSRQSVVISASDPRAQIVVDGGAVGTGTTTVELERNKSHAVMAKVDDRVGTAQIGTKISSTGMLDIVGGCLWLVPFIGVTAPGFHDLDTTNVNIAVPPAPASVAQVGHIAR